MKAAARSMTRAQQMRRAAALIGAALPIAVALLLIGAARPAASAPLSEAELFEQLRIKPKSADEIDAELAKGGGAATRRMQMPSREGACDPPAPAAGLPGTAQSRTLGVVERAPDGAPQANLDLQFEFASYKLLPPDRAQLDTLARVLARPELRTARFTVAGHTDAVGDPTTNLKLSCARSMAVREYLLGRGVAPERLSAYGFGSSLPIVQAVNAAANRRVEVRRADSM